MSALPGDMAAPDTAGMMTIPARDDASALSHFPKLQCQPDGERVGPLWSRRIAHRLVATVGRSMWADTKSLTT